jgi:sulfite exporter TauE/SafE/plastocyanin domain-containing protein/copper chaperone CopZ
MTCVNCQNKIEKKLRNTAGVTSASVDYGTGTADIAYDSDIISLRDICSVIERLDYKALANSESRLPRTERVVGLLVIIVALYALLSHFGILNLFVPSRLADTKTGYGMLLVIGLITSVHCVAMCGGINLSQCIPRGGPVSENGKMSAFRPALLYNLGRVIAYTVVGFMLGAVGLLFGGSANAGLSAFAQGILKLIAGVFMVIMGINMLGLFPWIRRLQPRMPKFLSNKAGAAASRSKSPFIVGLLNGLMPCGPLQSMQIVALSSGNPLVGALSMFLFSLGTVPLMLGLGSAVAALGQKFTKMVMTAGAVLVVVLGLAMLSQGGSLSGLLPPEFILPIVIGFCAAGIVSSLPFKKVSHRRVSTIAVLVIAMLALAAWNGNVAYGSSGNNGAAGEKITLADGKQIVTSTLSSGKYPDITVQAGTPVKWIINAPQGSVNGCNYRINIQEFGISNYDFKTGENIIEFTPTRAGQFRYTCWMGMIRGSITVTEADDISAAKDRAAEEQQTDSAAAGLAAGFESTPAGYAIPTNNVALATQTLYEDIYPVQEITIALTENGFLPAIMVVQSDLDVLWTIQNTYAGGDSRLLVPDYATAVALEAGGNQLSFRPDSDFAFSTGDNAFYGYVKVVDDVTTADIEAIKIEIGAFETLVYPPETFSQSDGGYDASQAVTARIENGVQYVTSTVGGNGYEPIRVRENLPVKWTIDMPEGALNSCNNAIYIPEYDMEVELRAGENLIEFTPDKSGYYVFSCWMGMQYGSITVEREDGSVDYAQDDGAGQLPSCCG